MSLPLADPRVLSGHRQAARGLPRPPKFLRRALAPLYGNPAAIETTVGGRGSSRLPARGAQRNRQGGPTDGARPPASHSLSRITHYTER